ncbi:hypothetical protein D3C74_460250 [compost metagenome]
MQGHKVLVCSYNVFSPLQRLKDIFLRLVNATHYLNDNIDVGVTNNFPRVLSQLCALNRNNTIFLRIFHCDFLNDNR